MFRQWTFAQKIAAGFALPLILLLIFGIVSYRVSNVLIDNSEKVTRSYAVIAALEQVVSLAKDAETGQRGYLLTSNETYLEPYNSAVTALPLAIASLHDLLSGSAAEQAQLELAQKALSAKLAELKETIDLNRSRSQAAALQLVAAGTGKQYMDEARRIIGNLDKEQRALLARYDADSRQSAGSARFTMLGAALAALALIALMGWFLVRSLNAQLRAAVLSTRSAAVELQSASTETATGSTEQKAAITEASTTLKELAATSRQMAESAQRVTRIAEDTTASTRNGDLTVQKAHEAINGIRRQVDLIVVHMLDLGKKSQQVGVVLEVINELSEQTNILAVNATIESAGAGDAGRRFGVVADEIRKLADRVGSSTKEIRTLIDEIRSAANTTVMATEDGSKAVDAGSRQFGEVAQVFKQIASGIETTTEAAREIELGSRQQVTAVDQVGTALQGILQAASQTETSTRQTQETAATLVTMSNELMRLVESKSE